MSRSRFITSILVLILVACSRNSSTTPDLISTELPEQPTPSEPAPIQVIEQLPTTSPTEPPVQEEQPTQTTSGVTGLITYKIVPGESQVSYEVGEVFINRNNLFKVAKGITPQITGEVVIDRQNPQNSKIGTINVDISQFTSDSPRRDNAIRERFLESARFPIAVFEPGTITGLPESYQDGETVNFQVNGDLTVREVTHPATFDVTIQMNGDTLTGQASSSILMSDFQVGPISIANILKTEDEVKLNFAFVARP